MGRRAGADPGRKPASNRSLRTRKDLLLAAGRLLAQAASPAGNGKVATPTMEEVALEALVSRATAYRYFPNVEALLVEAALDSLAPDPQALFAGDSSTDPLARVDRAEAAMHALTFDNEPQMRLMLLHALQQSLHGNPDGLPVRQNRRVPLIDAALAPVRARLGRTRYDRLCAALSLFLGPETMIVFRDVLRTDAAHARRVKSWAVRALVSAALAEADRAQTKGAEPAP